MQGSIASPIFIIPYEELTTTADSHDAIAGTHCFFSILPYGGDNKIIPHKFMEKTEPQFFDPARSSRGPDNSIQDHPEVPAGEFSPFDNYFPVWRSKNIFFPVAESGIA
jgi:hypothetical protein